MQAVRVICMVPSWTETLIEAGLDVVGRTQFCIHPADRVQEIPVVGGTKNIYWSRVKDLQADVLILDREENPKDFAEQSPIEVFATHVQDIPSCIAELERLAEFFSNAHLKHFAARFRNLKPRRVKLESLGEWISAPTENFSRVQYLIWRKPFMAVSRDTYIGSVLHMLGIELSLYDTKYPNLEHPLRADTLSLFSSEPYPFAREKEWIRRQNCPAMLVDGESFSWFGVRSLRFLE